MKILIIGDISSVFPNELAAELNKKQIPTSLLDLSTLEVLSYDASIDQSYSKRFKKYKQIPKVNVLIKFLLMGKIIKNGGFDIVNIHYSTWQYLLLLRLFRRSSSKLVITFYGSDFYRTSEKIKKRQIPLYKIADALTFTNPITKKSFLEYYQDFGQKSHVCRFGLKTLDYIDKNRKKNKDEIRQALGYKHEKIIVTCGYNASEEQQHEKIVDALQRLDTNLLSEMQFIFPLTYGDEKYKYKVKRLLEKSGLDYVVLNKFLYEDENAYIKLASDIMINVLQTDSFSGSMQEFLYADNIVITGKWLPYDVFDLNGIRYMKINKIEVELVSTLEDAVKNIKHIKKELELNRNIIANLSSWDHNIDIWIKTFRHTMLEK